MVWSGPVRSGPCSGTELYTVCRRTGVSDGRFADEQRVVGAVVGDDEASVAVDGHVGQQARREAQLVRVEAAPVVRHELDEVALRRLRNEAEAVAERVLLRPEAVVRRDHARSARRLRLGDPLQRREVRCIYRNTSPYSAVLGRIAYRRRLLLVFLLDTTRSLA